MRIREVLTRGDGSRTARTCGVACMLALALVTSCAAPSRSTMNAAQRRERLGFLALVWMATRPGTGPWSVPGAAVAGVPLAGATGSSGNAPTAPATTVAAPAPAAPPTTRPPAPPAAPVTAPQRPTTTRAPEPAAAPIPAPTGATTAIRWPGPSNTGVPAGTVLRASGPLTVTTPGAVVDGLDISGCLVIRADNVTVRRSRVTGNGCGRVVENLASNLLLEDVEINGNNQADHCLAWGSYTARRVNMHRCGDGAYLASNSAIESSWIHDLWMYPGSHNDAVQACGETGGVRNIVLRGNNFDVPVRGITSAIMLGTEFGNVDRVTIDRNRLNGGGLTLYGGDAEPSTGQPPATNVVVTNNTFGAGYEFGTHGYVSRSTVWAGNVMEGSGALVGR